MQVEGQNKSGKPILLICDGHGSHTTDIMLLKAKEHNIFIFRLPPHCTHKLQPLDVGILGPLQSKFSENIDTFVTQNGYGIGKREFIEEYIDAHGEAITVDLIRSAFKHCGISPFNPNVFTAEDFAPAQAFSLDATSHFPISFPADPSTDNQNTNPEIDPSQDSDSESNYSFATATTQSESDVEVMMDSDSESEYEVERRRSRRISQNHAGTVASDGEEEIMSQTSRKDLEKINASLRAQLEKKDDEIAILQAQIEQANAHAVILRRQCAPLIVRIHEKKQSRATGAIDPYARVMNTDEAIRLIKAQQLREEQESEYLQLRKEATERQGDRLEIWKDIPGWARLFFKLADRRKKGAERAAKKAEREQMTVDAKAVKAAQRSAEKAHRDKAREEVAKKRKEEREAEKAEKQREKEAEKAQKEAEKAKVTGNASGKRQRAGTTSHSKKKAKVSNGVVDDGAGQENDASIVVAHNDEGTSHLPASVTPTGPHTDILATAAQYQPQPRPKARYTGRKDVGINISDELSRATHFPPADQLSPAGLAQTMAAEKEVGAPPRVS